MYTFNLCLVLGTVEEVFILVCADDQPIDKEKVNRVATAYFKNACTVCTDMNQVISRMINGIKSECGCNAVIVKADAICHIPRKE